MPLSASYYMVLSVAETNSAGNGGSAIMAPRDAWLLPHPLNCSSPLYFSPTSVHTQLALRNALRYFPPSVQKQLAPEFAQELRQYGHIYMYRFSPTIEMRWVHLCIGHCWGLCGHFWALP